MTLACAACKETWNDPSRLLCPRCGKSGSATEVAAGPGQVPAPQGVRAGAPPARPVYEPFLTMLRPPAGRLLAYSTIGFMAFLVLFNLVQAAVEGFRAFALHNVLNQGAMIGWARDAARVSQTLYLASLLLGIPSAALGLRWIYVALHNLYALRVRGLPEPPGQALRQAFISPRFYYDLCALLQTIWRASEPSYPADSAYWRDGPASWLIGLWWPALIVAQVRVQISIAPFPLGNPTLLATLRNFALLNAGQHLVGASAAICFALIVFQTLRRQNARFDRLAGLD